jgi:hypothetical protein
MALSIAVAVTANFPRTEALILADATVNAIDYDVVKASSIERAKRDAYGTRTPPSESAMEEIVAQWIADRATILLIPVALEFVGYTHYRSRSNKQGDQIENYDLSEMLKALREELEASCSRTRDQVESIIGSAAQPRSLPKISNAGAMINPTDRALARGLP